MEMEEFYEFRKNIRKKLGRIILNEGNTASNIEYVLKYLTENLELSKEYLSSCTPNELSALYPIIKEIYDKNTRNMFMKILKKKAIYYGIMKKYE